MALAETAKLLASLDLHDGLTPVVKTMSRSLDKMDTRLGKSSTRAYKAGQQIGTGIKSGIVIAGAALTGLAGLLLVSAKEGQDAANVQKLYADAIVRSGKVSAAQVSALNAQQDAILNLTGADDELIKTEQTRLINMGLTGDAVQKLIPLIQDAAAATGKDAESITTAVGKAALGSTGALAKLGIIIPKTTAATKSAALVALERQKAELAVTKSLDASHGALTKHEKAVYAEKAAALDAAIGQQKLNDAQKKGVTGTDALASVTDVLTKSFGGAAAATSGSLDTRLEVLRQRLANIREEAGIKLLPAMTKIVDIVGQKLVPAFGQFIDAILPSVIAGLDQLSGFLEGGGATTAITKFLELAKTAAPIIKQSAEATLTIVQTAVGLFASLPPEIQALAVAGLTINKLTGGLVTNLAGGLISAVISSFKGLMNVNAAVVNVNGAVGGVGGLPTAAAAGSGGIAGIVSSALKLAFPVIGGLAVAAAFKSVAQDPGLQSQTAANQTAAEKLIASGATNEQLTTALQGATEGLRQLTNAGFAQPLVDALYGGQIEATRNTVATIQSELTRRSHLGPFTQPGINAFGGVGSAPYGPLTDALNANTAATKDQTSVIKPRTADVLADRAARGIKDTGPSKTINPRLTFLAAGHSGAKDVAVANALASGFESGKSPAFQSTAALKQAIKAVGTDIKTLPPKFTKPLTADLARLKGELARRTSEAATKTAAAARAAGIRTAAAVRDKDLSVTVNAPVTNRVVINGREISANLARYRTTVSGSIVVATGGGGK